MTISILKMEYVSGELEVRDDKLVGTLNSLLGAVIPQLNDKAREGFNNPAVTYYFC